jgi:hypothetical protein
MRGDDLAHLAAAQGASLEYLVGRRLDCPKVFERDAAMRMANLQPLPSAHAKR